VQQIIKSYLKVHETVKCIIKQEHDMVTVNLVASELLQNVEKSTIMPWVTSLSN